MNNRLTNVKGLIRNSMVQSVQATALTLIVFLALIATASTGTVAQASARETIPVPGQVVATFEPGEFLESIAFDRHGTMYITSAIKGVIYAITPDGHWTIFASFPVGEGGFGQQPGILGTLAIDRQGTLYATLSHTDPELHGVWQIMPDGSKTRLATLPAGAQPNGITLDRRANLFVADSALGIVWRIPKGSGNAEIWVEHDMLRPVVGTGFPGANGLKFYRHALYVANSSAGTIVRVPVDADGRAGLPAVYAENVPTDDFAFDVLGNLYATTHPFNTVVRIGRDGTQTVLAGPDQGVIGPTAAAFGVRGSDRMNLYVVTDGGFFGALIDPNSPIKASSIVRLQIRIPGLPVQ